MSLSAKIKAIARSYAYDPVGYVTQYLHIDPTRDQRRILEAVHEPPFRFLVQASNNVGKSFFAACIARYHYDCFDPSITLITGPVANSVTDVIFRELRTISPLKGGFLPVASRLQDGTNHFVHGFTASSEEAFKGRHADRMMFILDEAIRLDRFVWTGVRSMFKSNGKHFVFGFFNPTSTGSPLYMEQHSGDYRIFTMNALSHDNIVDALAGRSIRYPAAIDIGTVRDRIRMECEPIPTGEHVPTRDFEFEGCWYRPTTPDFEVQILGRYPSQTVDSLWSAAIWDRANTPRELPERWKRLLQFGVDVARGGSDPTVIHGRYGAASFLHECHYGWRGDMTAKRIKQLCMEYAAPGVDPRSVPVAVDDIGVGAGVMDNANDFNFIGVNSSRASADPRYFNLRSQLWFNTFDLAYENLIDVTRMPPLALDALRQQLFAVKFGIDSSGRRRIEPKDETRRRIGRSPDDADAFNLAYIQV